MSFAPGSGAWLAALCSSRVLSATWFVAYSAGLPLVREDWGLSARDAGMIQGAFHLGYLASLFIVGFIADRFGAKRAFLVTGVAGFLSPIAFVLLVDDFQSAIWLHALTGLTQGGYYTPVLAMVNEHVERRRRGRAMGLMIAASSAGYALALGAAGLVLAVAGWRAALAVVAAMPVVSWLIALAAPESRDPQHRAPAARGAHGVRRDSSSAAQPEGHAFRLGLHLPQLGTARVVGLAARLLDGRAALERKFS